MNRKLFIFSLVLIVVGLLGVSAVQTLWLKAAIENRKADFDQRVYESMEEIAYGIENLNYQPYIDELIKDMQLDTNTMRDFNQFQINDSIIAHQESFTHPQAQQKPINKEEFAKVYKSQIREFQEMLVREMISLRPIDEIIDIKQLEPFIRKTLELHGIKTDFHYGITEFADNNFVFVSKGSDLGALYHTPYTTKLFRRSYIDGNKLLKLSFPEQKKFLIHSFLMPIISSILFMLMIIVAFIVSFRIIFHQKRLSDMKTDFINNMTHELKTPIATISLASEMLKDNTISTNEKSRLRYAGIIFEENKRLANHVEQVLQIARLEKGDLQLNLEEREIHGLIRSLVHHFDLISEDYNAVIELDLKANPSTLKIDEMHFNNSIKNLIDNALKYNDKKPLIQISTKNTLNGVMISVKDNGIGLNKDNQNKIFDKFYRVQSGNIHDTKGFGLGLNYVKSIIDAHNGTISVESKLKEGTTFNIYLPYKNN
ncbi:MAG TPA: HAMP domain-containing sensor histidine kinase [Chitinophagales bacterium]|nr:HAMP domain-containing sensor histidine kinase [Chitinophagales bacterium]